MAFSIALSPVANAVPGAKAPSCGEFTPCESPSRFRFPQKITVQAVAQPLWAEASSEAACKRFRLTARQVRLYFRRAGEVTANAQHYAGSDSSCVALGRAWFGKDAVAWKIGFLKEATLTLENGEVVHLYCSRCALAPFVD